MCLGEGVVVGGGQEGRGGGSYRDKLFQWFPLRHIVSVVPIHHPAGHGRGGHPDNLRSVTLNAALECIP